MAKPPPLPPRQSSVVSTSSDEAPITGSQIRSDTIHLTPHSSPGKPHNPYSVGFGDPRTSSTQSLHPVESAGPNRRTLLIVYIHGFLGDETSFQSFPAHIHNILSSTLTETHVVYSKIYPRYKSRKNITFARDDFSKWLTSLESPSTDVILVGHSLGGILAAEVALIPAHYGQYEHLHHLLGILAVDVPYLGMHPGVVSTGIASLFRSPPPEQAEPQPVPSDPTSPSSTFSDFSMEPADPNFNPAFPNDVRLTTRKGKLNRAWYFWNKHWGELGKATQSYVTSHLEFGGCLADYPGLRRRYDAVRSLEDVDEYSHARAQSGRWLRRVRFVNYYSASTGRIKEREHSLQHGSTEPDALNMQGLTVNRASQSGLSTPQRASSPRISIEEHRDGKIIEKALELPPEDEADHTPDESPMDNIEPRPLTPDPTQSPDLTLTKTDTTTDTRTDTSTGFPRLPPLPSPPAPFDPSAHSTSDPESLKLAQKEHERAVKAHERLRKDREKTLRDREKLVMKRRKAEEKEREKERVRLEKERVKRSMTLNKEDWDKSVAESAATASVGAASVSTSAEGPSASAVETATAPQPQVKQQPAKQRDRKFCSLPSKDSSGHRDKCWVRVYMQGMDEVVAHTSMFKMGDVYERLVGDVCERIEGWVGEEGTRKAVLEAQG